MEIGHRRILSMTDSSRNARTIAGFRAVCKIALNASHVGRTFPRTGESKSAAAGRRCVCPVGSGHEVYGETIPKTITAPRTTPGKSRRLKINDCGMTASPLLFVRRISLAFPRRVLHRFVKQTAALNGSATKLDANGVNGFNESFQPFVPVSIEWIIIRRRAS